MNLFADYVQPLTNWLQANPHWSLFITFIIALAESLAIIGSIVPGSVTMTAIGILAGSGIMRIDLTLVAATLGAVCGDSLSYAIGYFYSERLIEIWPFKKYPNLLIFGKDFFSRHGGKSVLIGRFVGPLRSIIPVIAGIMHMKQWRFLIANFISAIGWSILYIMPGVLIGTAGHELSAEGATRLFVIILVILAVFWLIGLLIKWLLSGLNFFLRSNLHNFWLGFKKTPKLSRLYNAITPSREHNHYATAGLLLLTLVGILCLVALLIINLKTKGLNNINLPVYLFIQSFHTFLLEAFFIGCTQLTSAFTLVCLYIICCMWFIYHQKLKSILYLTSLVCVSFIVAIGLPFLIKSPRPIGLLVTMPGSSFPAINLVIATALYGFIFFYINNKYALLTNTFRTFILIVLGLSGLGAVYLGDYWLTDVLGAYFIGTIICLIHCLIYRKFNQDDLGKEQSATMLITLFVGILFATAISTFLNYKVIAYDHTPHHQQFSLTTHEWWEQQKPVLPLYRLNRIGKRISLLNIQYAGELDSLQKSLEDYGWKLHSESFLTKLAMRMNAKTDGIKLPLLVQLYENKRPELVMSYFDKEAKLILELTVWESNYNLSDFNKPIWIGTIHQNLHDKRHPGTNVDSPKNLTNAISYLMPALNKFVLRRLNLGNSLIKSTTYPTQPIILLIKNRRIDK